MPDKYGEAVIVSPNTGPSDGTKLTTPDGTPASVIISYITQFDNKAVSEGFHKTEHPWNNTNTLQFKKYVYKTNYYH